MAIRAWQNARIGRQQSRPGIALSRWPAMNDASPVTATSKWAAATVPGRYLANAANVAARLGYRNRAWLQRAGLDLRALAQAGSRISSVEYDRAITLLVKDSGVPGLGLRVGGSESAADHGVVGHAMLCAPTAGAALDFFIEFQDITGPVVHVSREMRGSQLVLRLSERGISGIAGLYEIENTMIGLLGMLSGGGPRPRALRVQLAYADPGYPDLYREYFGCRVDFRQAHNELWLPARILRQVSPLANEEFFELCRRQCEVIRAKLTPLGSLPEQVRWLMASSAGSFPTEERIAQSLGISERTLRRRLAQEGTGFRRMLDDARIALAKEHLRSSRRAVAEIAKLVGYTGVHSFHRAFKRATSLTPAAYRSGARAQDD
ncbi:MAG: AraC family transcriptional regulator [Dehalococcoidia bacterium]